MLLLFCLFLRPVISFPFCCVLEANTKVDRCFRHCFRRLFRALGHGVLWFCFLVALRFECMLASLFVCCICSSCHGVSFLFCFSMWGPTKGGSVFLACCVPLCFVFVYRFLVGGCALVCFFVSSSFFLLFSWAQKRWISLELCSGFRPCSRWHSWFFFAFSRPARVFPCLVAFLGQKTQVDQCFRYCFRSCVRASGPCV